MKLLLFLCFIILVSCKNDEETFSLLSQQAFELNSGEHLLSIGIHSESEWKVEGDTTWCKFKKIKGEINDTLLIYVSVNLVENARQVTWKVLFPQKTEEIHINQEGTTEEYHYRLPVIFHFLSNNKEVDENCESSFNENLEKRCLSLLQEANAFFAGQNRQKIDVNVEFVPVTTTPWGTRLERPGVHWQYHEFDVFDFIDERKFIDNAYGDTEKLWDPTKYINIYIFDLRYAMGRTALPYTPENNPLPGLLIDDKLYREYPPDDFVPCVTLDCDSILSTNGRFLLIHELGHYLGLFHAFSKNETPGDDYCEDTPDYNRAAYDEWERAHHYSATFEEKIKRTDRNNNVFISTNIEDYPTTYGDEITPDQRKRIRHVLNYSPMMPGPKIPITLNIKSKSNNPTHLVME